MATRKISVAGYEIGDVTSLLALATALASIGWLLSSWWIGANVDVLPPTRIELACEDDNDCHADSHLMVVLDRLQLVNYGASGYDMLVDPGTVTVSFKNTSGKELRALKLHSLYFSKRTTVGIDREPARFILVKGRAVVTHEVEYVPRRVVSKDGTVSRKNYMKFKEFKSWLADDSGPRIVEIVVKPRSVIDTSTAMSSTCRVIVDKDMIENATDPHVGTFPRDCVRATAVP